MGPAFTAQKPGCLHCDCQRDEDTPELRGAGRVGDREVDLSSDQDEERYDGVPEVREHLPGEESGPSQGHISGGDVGLGRKEGSGLLPTGQEPQPNRSLVAQRRVDAPTVMIPVDLASAEVGVQRPGRPCPQ